MTTENKEAPDYGRIAAKAFSAFNGKIYSTQSEVESGWDSIAQAVILAHQQANPRVEVTAEDLYGIQNITYRGRYWRDEAARMLNAILRSRVSQPVQAPAQRVTAEQFRLIWNEWQNSEESPYDFFPVRINAIAAHSDNSKTRALLQRIYDVTEGNADGAPDATSYDQLCNQISGLAKDALSLLTPTQPEAVEEWKVVKRGEPYAEGMFWVRGECWHDPVEPDWYGRIYDGSGRLHRRKPQAPLGQETIELRPHEDGIVERHVVGATASGGVHEWMAEQSADDAN